MLLCLIPGPVHLTVIIGVLSALVLFLVVCTAVLCAKRKKKNNKGIKFYSDPRLSPLAVYVTAKEILDLKILTEHKSLKEKKSSKWEKYQRLSGLGLMTKLKTGDINVVWEQV